jgi:predicted transposase YbfD/YdcC
VDAKSNEIPAVRELLKAFAALAGAVLTIDAMYTQHDTAQLILARRADYVMTVKANRPTLYKQLKKLPWACIPSVSSLSAAEVAQLRRTVTKKGKKTVEVVYLITSDRDADPETLAAWVRGHWHIEVRHEVALSERDNRIGGSNDRRLTPGECSAPVPAPGMRRW